MINVIPLLTIASLNIASSGRDEATNPLFGRLPYIVEFIKEEQRNDKYSILCIQEIRPTGTNAHDKEYALQAFDVALAIKNALGKNWDFLNHKINPSDGAFYRAIFWNSDIYSHHSTNYTYTKNTKESHFPYIFTKSYFTTAKSKTNVPFFSVINGHAPMLKNDRIEYWIKLREAMDKNTIIVGDLNKFEAEQSQYDQIFSGSVSDLIKPDTLTFVSFDTDRKPNGELWRSSLDACIIDHEYYGSSQVSVISTEKEPRPTDHFMIKCSVNLECSSMEFAQHVVCQ